MLLNYTYSRGRRRLVTTYQNTIYTEAKTVVISVSKTNLSISLIYWAELQNLNTMR